jgi:hypothetical protein
MESAFVFGSKAYQNLKTYNSSQARHVTIKRAEDALNRYQNLKRKNFLQRARFSVMTGRISIGYGLK